MPDSDQVPPQRTEFEIRWNQRSHRSNLLLLVPIFGLYAALIIFGSGTWRLIGTAGVVVFGLVLLYGALWAQRMSRTPVAARLTEFGVTFRRREPVAWENLREVRFGAVKPSLFFALRPLYYIGFLPERVADLPHPTLRERLAIRIYGTNLLLMTQTVTPSADDILTAVQRLSDRPIRR